jgi:predicted TIM-barrel fold metal-dependent hydrolase
MTGGPAPWPPQALRVAVTDVPLPRFPVISMHEHLGPVFGGDWHERPVSELLATMDEVGIVTMVDLDGGQGDALSRQVERYHVPHPDRVLVFAGLDYAAWATEADFGALEAVRLRDSIGRGARGLKVWKLLGLRARDIQGRLVGIDDARLDPLWRTADELRVPVVIHIADPIAFFGPLDTQNERAEELALHPDWHFWPPMVDAAGPGFPGFDDLLAAFDRLLGRFPGVTFIGAHVGCASEDLALVTGMLQRHPNLYVDIAARIGELGRQPNTARRFILDWADRIVFGTDTAIDVASCRRYYRFLETLDDSFDYSPDPVPPQGRWRISGLGLPDDVLQRVYMENARRILGTPEAGASHRVRS